MVNTKPIVKIICSPDLLESFARTSQIMPGWKVYDFIINNNTLEVVKYDHNIHDVAHVFKDKIKEGIYCDDEMDEWHNNFQNNHRRFTLAGSSWVIKKIQDMYNTGIINPFM
jgi:hypothetical protein